MECSKREKRKGKFPPWIRVRTGCGTNRDEVSEILSSLKLNTVCASAQCPNLNECWHRRTSTFMILGNACTRNCKFCAVSHDSHPAPPDSDEPARVAEACARMGLKYVVITSVTRDDLPDGGAGLFAATINEIRRQQPEAGIEVLTPDFNADSEALQQVITAAPTVFNHNLETVERLSRDIRSKANYQRSLKVLGMAAQMADDITSSRILVKSGIMVGLGETDDEVLKTIEDIYNTGARILTIGQYLPPSKTHWPLDRYVEPEKFDQWGKFAREIGFEFVASGPMVRSSYNAGELVGKN